MTRILLVSDIHANLAALDAVLRDVENSVPIDAIWSLGDTVGYGPQPSECLDRLQAAGAVAVAGNHELAALGSLSTADFNPYAREAAEWTGRVLTDSARAYAESLPLKLEAGDFTLVHGSPRDPVWECMTDEHVARQNVGYLETPNCVNGHTHVPASFFVPGDAMANDEPTLPQFEDAVYLVPNRGNWFLNPGSVGQPRDGDPRAAYAVLEPESLILTFHRVEYPVAKTQALMEEIGLPPVLYQRLAHGY